jgi:beta-lactamase class A
LPSALLAQETLRREIAAIAAEAHGKVSVACSLPGTALNCDFNASAHPPMQSVFKAPLALTALHLVEQGKLSLDDSIRFLASDRILPQVYSPLQDQYPAAGVDIPLRRLLDLAVSRSDNVAADIVLRVIDGPKTVDSYIKECGIGGFHIEDNEATLHRDGKAQYRNWFEPAGAVQFLRLLNDRPSISAEHAALLLGWMRDTDRAPQRIKGRLPTGTVVMHKPGTSDTDRGLTPATNDIGLIVLPDGRRLAIAIFVTDSTADDATRDSVIARIARAAYDAAIDGGSGRGCREALAQHAVCDAANRIALDAMTASHLEAVSVVQDVRTGALVAFAASEPSKLDASTQVLPLSLSKVFLAASWWDRQQPDVLESALPGKSVDLHEMLVGGSDSAGRQVALALRRAVGTQSVLSDLRRFGFNGGGESLWVEVDPQWRQRLTPQPAYANIEALTEEDWSSALSIGESYMMTTALQVSRFFQAVGNGGLLCVPVALRMTAGRAPAAGADCQAPTRMVEEATAGKLMSAAIDTVERGSARRIAGALHDSGWAIGGKTGTGGRTGAPMDAQDGWFAGLIFDRQGKARYSVATFVRRGGLGSGHAAEISVALARFLGD